MEDGQTTVSMSLERFKQLESYEAVFNALQDNENFIWYNGWNKGYVVSKSLEPPAELVVELKFAVASRDDAYKRLREYEEKEKNKRGFFS